MVENTQTTVIITGSYPTLIITTSSRSVGAITMSETRAGRYGYDSESQYCELKLSLTISKLMAEVDATMMIRSSGNISNVSHFFLALSPHDSCHLCQLICSCISCTHDCLIQSLHSYYSNARRNMMFDQISYQISSLLWENRRE